jgi:hypothetical protein
MANLIIGQSEMLFLREGILKKYCASLNEDYDSFCKKITAYIVPHNDIADNISEYLNDDRHILGYTKFISESRFKNVLKKWLEENGKTGKQKSQNTEPSVSGNIIRKLIFYGPSEKQLSFKDYFILACYIYIGEDRAVIVKKIPGLEKIAGPDTSAKKTVPPGLENELATSNSTIFPFERENGFSLKPLDKSADAKALSFQYSGDEIVLNRANLDPSNLTITSRIQAKITFENGKWKITNVSDLKTTYIQVVKTMTLEKGDVIVFGNKHFLFDDLE